MTSEAAQGPSRGEGARLPRVRVAPEDFVVDEVPLYPASGAGPHTFVRIEKRLRNSDEVARELAKQVGVAPREVGMAGRKDRRAVTRQWFSVPGLDPVRALELQLRDARILEAHRHGHKLRTGHLAANRFLLCVREVQEGAAARARERLAEIQAVGMPNRFGAQRFGRNGDNAERGLAILTGRTASRRLDRRAARFAVSALQSQVFNRVLERRTLPLDQLEAGDVARVEASGGLFLVSDPTLENPRAAAFEISATGPIFGRKMKSAEGAVAEREASVLRELGVPDLASLQPPRGIRVAGARRPLRVAVGNASFEFDLGASGGAESDVSGGTVRLGFTLPPGSYGTVLLEELFGTFEEVTREPRDDDDPSLEGNPPPTEKY